MTTGGTFLASTGNLYPTVVMATTSHAGTLVQIRVMNTLVLMVPVIVGISMADGTMVHCTSSLNGRMGYHATLLTMCKGVASHVGTLIQVCISAIGTRPLAFVPAGESPRGGY